jgi:type II secretory pathway predicted ATPase ExeA
MSALFYDLSTEKQVHIPSQGERRIRDLRDLVKKGRRPVALFVDEAHDLHGKTLTGIKRTMEGIADGNKNVDLSAGLKVGLTKPETDLTGTFGATFKF